MCYVNLHSHTIFSALDGHALVPAYVQKVAGLGHTHAAITDHGTMAGVPEFVAECDKHGVTPIVGMEAYVEPEDATKRDDAHAGTFHLTLLAINQTGYRNLIALATLANSKGFYRKPRVDWRHLERHNEGLVVLSGCTSGELAKAIISGDTKRQEATLDFYTSVFGRERYFLEFQNHGDSYEDQQRVNRRLFELSKRTGLLAVGTNDSHFCDPEDFTAQQLLVGVRRNQKVEDVQAGSKYTFVRTNDEMRRAFGDSMLLETSLLIAGMVEPYKLGDRTPKLPSSPLERMGQSPTDTLLGLVRSGLERRLGVAFPAIPGDYRTRLDTEIDVIKKLSEELGADFGRYLLVIADICRFCKDQRIRFGPRGSAAGSLVCWALGISEPDPIKDNLYFERFLNPYRVELPDVDLDFADNRREEVFRYIRDTYGEAQVVKIGTYAMIGAKQALKDAARGLQTNFEAITGGHTWVAKQLVDLIPDDPRPGGIPLNELMESPLGGPMQELINTPGNEHLRPVLADALKLEGRARGDGMHAAGVVVCDRPVADILPLAWTNQARKEKEPIIPFQTQYEMGHLEKLGLLKVDILGLKTLSVLDAALERINAEVGAFVEAIDPWRIPWDDRPTWDLIRSGRTLSLFQIGSEGLGGACHQLQPDTIEDLALTVAVYRPGPMKNFKQIVARKRGEELTSIHPAIDHIMANTYGFPVYQEQVMEIARTFAGYSLGEADLLRKAMGKKIREKMAEERVKFFAGSEALGHTPEEAQYVWDFIVPFADYGFNRAHAICYAYVAYQTAYLKANFPQSFYAAAMTVEASTGGEATPQQRIGNLVREAREVLTILPPDVNFPCTGFEPEGQAVRYGLSCVKGVGVLEAREIVQARACGPFTGVHDFVHRCPGVKRGAIEILVKVGAVPSLYTRRALTEPKEITGPRGGKKTLTWIGRMVEARAKARKSAGEGQASLFEAGSYVVDDADLGIPELPEYTSSELLLAEQQHLGMFTSPFPRVSQPTWTIARVREDNTGPKELEGSEVVMMGVITQVVHTITKKTSQTMGYASLLDETDSGWNLVFFHRVYDRIVNEPKRKLLLGEGQLVFVRGKIKTDPTGDCRMFVEDIWKVQVDEPAPTPVKTIDPRNRITIEGELSEALGRLTEIFTLAGKHPGAHEVSVLYGNTVETVHLSEVGLMLLDDQLG